MPTRLTLPGTSGSHVSPGNPQWVDGNFNFNIDMSITTFPPAASAYLVSALDAPSVSGWAVSINSAGKIVLTWYDSEGEIYSAVSTGGASNGVAPITAGTRFYLQVIGNVVNGEVSFKVGADSGSLASVGGLISVATGVGDVGASNTFMFIGSLNGTQNLWAGKVYSLVVGGGLTPGAGAYYNPDFTAKAAGTTSFADTALTPVTWTVNGSAAIETYTAAALPVLGQMGLAQMGIRL